MKKLECPHSTNLKICNHQWLDIKRGKSGNTFCFKVFDMILKFNIIIEKNERIVHLDNHDRK